MAKEGVFRTGRVGLMLRLSRHQVRRLCETGLIEAELGPGRQWRIPSREVVRLQKEGVPPVPSATNEAQPADVGLRNGGSAAAKVSPWHDTLAAKPQPLVSSGEKASVVGDHVERRRTAEEEEFDTDWPDETFRQPNQAQPGVNREEALQVVRAREQWHNRWLESALWMVPCGTPEEYRLEVRQEVDKTLQSLQPQTPESLTRQLVEGAVQRGLRTWRDFQDTEKAISSALRTRPVMASAPWQHTNWQIRAREDASSAVSGLSDGASFEAKLAAAAAAVQKVTRQFEEQNLRQKIIGEFILLPVLSGAEKEDARAAIRTSVEGSRPGATEAELRRARQAALKPFEETNRQRVERQTLERKVDQELAHVRTFLLQLWNSGELDGFQGYSEVWRYADEIREDVRTDLLKELYGKPEVSNYRIKTRIEEIVDQSLG